MKPVEAAMMKKGLVKLSGTILINSFCLQQLKSSCQFSLLIFQFYFLKHYYRFQTVLLITVNIFIISNCILYPLLAQSVAKLCRVCDLWLQQLT